MFAGHIDQLRRRPCRLCSLTLGLPAETRNGLTCQEWERRNNAAKRQENEVYMNCSEAIHDGWSFHGVVAVLDA